MLTAVSTLADPDGLGTLHYDWQRDTGSGFVNIGARPGDLHAGRCRCRRPVRVVVSYTDGGGTAEAATSAATAAVAAVNDPHTGGVSITGTATEDQVLTADTSTLADVDGLGTLHYQWQHDVGSGFVNIGADQATYTLGDGDVGGVVRVVVSYTDGQGFAESATSAATAAIANVNDPPTGGVAVTGTATENQVLTADTSTLADADGLGTLHYQWQRDIGGGFVNVGRRPGDLHAGRRRCRRRRAGGRQLHRRPGHGRSGDQRRNRRGRRRQRPAYRRRRRSPARRPKTRC